MKSNIYHYICDMEKPKLTETLLLRMDSDTKKALEQNALKAERSLNWYVTDLIKKDIKEKEGK